MRVHTRLFVFRASAHKQPTHVFIQLPPRPDAAVQVYTVSHHVEGGADARLDVTLNYDVSHEPRTFPSAFFFYLI